jgi:hypothetical protein
MTSEALEAEVWRLFEMLDAPIKEATRAYWYKYGRDCPVILTQDDHIDGFEEVLGGTINLAASTGGTLCFRIERIEASGEDMRLVILHELAHCYLFAIRKFNYHVYYRDERHRDRCEKATIALSRMWFKRICYQDRKAQNHDL